ncbi:MAG: hypothetical protein E6I91_07620 [Chloroflexi bacterium]|nr:MAG: hypothetical protein E6I91_07620 [Chloroflexota bacterium]
MTFQDVLICVLILLVGAAFCFVGYRFFRGLIAVWGFFAGFNLGAAGMTALFGQNFLGTTTGWILGLVVGLVFAVVASIVVAPDIAHITNDHGQGQNESDLVLTPTSSSANMPSFLSKQQWAPKMKTVYSKDVFSRFAPHTR